MPGLRCSRQSLLDPGQWLNWGVVQGLQLLLTRESVEEPPQYHILTLRDGGKLTEERCISSFPHPYPTVPPPLPSPSYKFPPCCHSGLDTEPAVSACC